jgi:hypothetical protein
MTSHSREKALYVIRNRITAPRYMLIGPNEDQAPLIQVDGRLLWNVDDFHRHTKLTTSRQESRRTRRYIPNAN